MLLKNNFNHLALTIGMASVLALFSCNSTEQKTDATTTHTDSMTMTQSEAVTSAKAVITGTNADTTVEGTATFNVENGKVKMVLNLTIPKMANKSVAVHLHEHGACGNMGKDAHGHWNPTQQQHGKWGSAAFHLGDIGNVALDANGVGSLTMETDLWTIGGNGNNDILNRSFIVHNGEDDFTSQPSGNAGTRIGCGVITK